MGRLPSDLRRWPFLRLAFPLALLAAAAGCGTPVSVRRVDPRTVHRELRRAYFVSPLPCVRRVVFMATPHRGSYMAGSWIAQQLAGFITLPARLVDVSAELLTGNPGAIPLTAAGGLLSSVHNMTPGSPFVKGLASLSPAPGVAVHSVVAVDGDGPVEDGDDGVVEYSSAHLEEADSELVVRAGHSVQSHPLAIAEVRRILRLHAAAVDGEGSGPAEEENEEGPPRAEELLGEAAGGAPPRCAGSPGRTRRPADFDVESGLRGATM